LEYISTRCFTITKSAEFYFASTRSVFLSKMSNELHLEGAGHDTTPVKKGVYKELRANPYLLGLSTVSGHSPV
jgi:hypothetical protein